MNSADNLKYYIEHRMWALHYAVKEHLKGEASYSTPAFKNEVFEIQPYDWECDCDLDGDNDHIEGCNGGKPNFKSGALEIDWYKHIGRSQIFDGVSTIEEASKIFNACEESLRKEK
jgi:hypothetical protein